jgi:hypothetical protein
MASFIGSMDEGIRALLYSKFGTTLGLTSAAADTAFFPKPVALRKIAETRGRTSMEFISLWRENTGMAWNRMSTPVARSGLSVEYTSAGKTAITRMKAIPVNLEYSFWIWSQSLAKLQEVTDLYLFWQQADPNLNLTLNSKYPLEIDLHFGDIIDESVVAEQYDKGQYFVYKFPLKVDGWVFSAGADYTIKTIHVAMYEDTDPPILLYEETITFTV